MRRSIGVSETSSLAHGTVNHSAEEYGRGMFWHTNTVENFFSIFKCGVYGCYFHVSETHLHRYAAEFDFRHNNRIALGIDDLERTAARSSAPRANGLPTKQLISRGGKRRRPAESQPAEVTVQIRGSFGYR
jgi:hypothetical protein